MKAGTLQIVWHAKDPVYSLDFHPSGLLATAGGDKEIKIWRLASSPDGTPRVDLVAELQGHARSVNCVRWAPTAAAAPGGGPDGNGGGGATLVSAGDGGEVFLWRCAELPAAAGEGGAAATPAAPALAAAVAADPFGATSRWRAVASLRGHSDDVFDAAWAPDGSALATASLENLAILWEVPGAGNGPADQQPPRSRSRLGDHRHYVQGVAWDPAGVYVATQSADRSVRVYGPPAGGRAGGGGGKKKGKAGQHSAHAAVAGRLADLACVATLARRPPREGEAPAVAGAPAAGEGAAAQAAAAAPRSLPLFADEQLPTFFRRLAWSPEGSVLAVPAGLLRPGGTGGSGGGGGGAPVHAAYLYARGYWASPAVALPSARPVVAVRFCPVLFEKKAAAEADAPAPMEEDGAPAPTSTWPFDALPYRMVLALATLDGVALYDTASPRPLAFLGGLHPAPITDLAWACDGSALAVSSYDSYCSVATFEPGELGTPLAREAVPPHVAARVAAAAKAGAPPPPPPTPAGAAASARTAGAPVAPPPPRFDGGSAVKRIQPSPIGPSADGGGGAPFAGTVPPGPRRVVPEAIGGGGGLPPPGPSRRIVPEPVGGVVPPVAAAAGPTPRRIAPTPVGAPTPAPAPADAAVTVSAPAPPSAEKAVAAASTAPGGTGSLFPAGGIAAMAAQAGAAAAAKAVSNK